MKAPLTYFQRTCLPGHHEHSVLRLGGKWRRCDGRTAARSSRPSAPRLLADVWEQQPAAPAQEGKLHDTARHDGIGGLAATRRLGVAVVDGAAGSDPVLDDAAAPVRGGLHDEFERESPGRSRTHNILCRIR